MPIAPGNVVDEATAEMAQAYEKIATPEILEAVATITDHGGRVTFFTRSPQLIDGSRIDSPTPYFAVQFDATWKGTASDVKRLVEIKPLRMLHLDLNSAPQSVLADLAPLGATLENLTLVGASDEGMAQLAELPALSSLTMHRGRDVVTGEGLKHLTKMPALRNLSLLQVECSDAALAPLAELRHLESLQLIGNEQPGPQLDMPWIAKLTKLQRLHLIMALPTPIAMERISRLPGLRQLMFEASLLDDDSFARLRAMENLRRLTVSKAGNISAKGWSSLADCKRLSWLQVYDPGVSEECVVAMGNVKTLNSLVLADTTVGAAGLAAIGGLTNLRLLIVNTSADDPDFAPLAALQQLESLQLTAEKLGNEACRPIGELENLKSLTLVNAEINDPGFAHLAKLAQLKTLNVIGKPRGGFLMADPENSRRIQSFTSSGTVVTDDALQAFRSHHSLHTLGILGAVWTDKALAPLVDLQSLRMLSLFGSEVSVGVFDELGNCAQLVSLSLARTNVIDDDLNSLARLKNLRELDLSNTKITDAGLLRLSPLEKLRNLVLHDSEVTDDGFHALKAQLPNVQRPTMHGLLSVALGFDGVSPWTIEAPGDQPAEPAALEQ